MALYDVIPLANAFRYDERAGVLTRRFRVRAPRGLALQAPQLPARGDVEVYMGESLTVRYGRRIVGLDRFGSPDEADDLTEVEVDYERTVDTFAGGSALSPDDPDVELFEGSGEPYEVTIPFHVTETVTAQNSAGNTVVFAIFTPAPAVFETTLEVRRVSVNLQVFGPPELAAISGQRGKLHAIGEPPGEPTHLFEDFRFEQIAPSLTKVWYTWKRLRPITLDPTPVAGVYKPGDGPNDEYPLPPFADWIAIPGEETGEGATLRRTAPTFKVINRREVGDPSVLPGNPAAVIVNGAHFSGGA